MTKSLQISGSLFQDLRSLIIEARQDVARQVNSALVLLYWRVGQRIRKDILKEKRADYGEQIVATLSQQLTEEFGEGWSSYNLSRMMRFTECFPCRANCRDTVTTIGLEPFRRQLTEEEFSNLKSQIVISSWGGLRCARPYAFTEQGVAMLSELV